MARDAGFEDVFVFFFAGHGEIDSKEGYYALTFDTKVGSPLLTGKKLSELLNGIKAKTIVILETCQSGGVFGGERPREPVNSPKDLKLLENQLSSAEEGTVVVTSAGYQSSFQDPDKGGPLTQALLERLTLRDPHGANQKGGEDLVTCVTLRDWVTGRVEKIVEEMRKAKSDVKSMGSRVTSKADYDQHPTFLIPVGVPDFPVARTSKKP